MSISTMLRGYYARRGRQNVKVRGVEKGAVTDVFTDMM